MSEQKIQEKLDSIQNCFRNLGEAQQAEILKEITAAIASYVRSENNENDATDGIFDTLGEIAESVQEKFKALVGISNDKKTL